MYSSQVFIKDLIFQAKDDMVVESASVHWWKGRVWNEGPIIIQREQIIPLRGALGTKIPKLTHVCKSCMKQLVAAKESKRKRKLALGEEK